MPSKTIITIQQFRTFPHEWALGLCGVPCSEPCCCIASALFFPCASFSVRKEALGGDLSNGRYQCCQGYYCSCCTSCIPCQSACPSLCLCLEVLEHQRNLCFLSRLLFLTCLADPFMPAPFCHGYTPFYSRSVPNPKHMRRKCLLRYIDLPRVCDVLPA